METINSLPHLIPQNNTLQIRITNERPETHYINSVQLFKYHSRSDDNLIADADRKVWPVMNPRPPQKAVVLHKNIIGDVGAEDGIYWESDLSSVDAQGRFIDSIVLTFPHNTKRSSSLIVKAINTRISDVLFRKIYDFLGDEILPFVNAAENDPEVIAALNDWIQDVSLKAFVWKGDNWEYAGILYPEATKLPFKKLIRINLANINTG